MKIIKNVLFLMTASVLVLVPSSALATLDNKVFSAFLGEWTLKDDRFEQVWDGKTVQTLTIPNHHTLCKTLNTAMSVLCLVNAGDLKGHILWAMDGDTQQVHHLSHFGTSRLGVGTGQLDEQGNFTSTVTFQGEPSGSYRVYEYRWVNKNEYTMLSTQYDASGQATGNWYGGTFVRLPTASP